MRKSRLAGRLSKPEVIESSEAQMDSNAPVSMRRLALLIGFLVADHGIVRNYSVILKNDRILEYGPGPVRQRDPNTLILVPLVR